MTNSIIYREVRPDGKRTFALAGGSLAISGANFLKSSFEQTVSLADADANVTLIWVRSKVFFALFYLGLICAAGGALARGSGWATDENLADLVLWGFAVLFVLLSLSCIRPIKFTQFRNRSGIVLFDVAQAGPDRKRYDEFVAAILAAIPGPRSA